MVYKVMVTGHRPNKLDAKVIPLIKLELLERVERLRDEHSDLVLVTGMALGVDTLFADIGLKLGIPVHAVIPFNGQSSVWNMNAQKHYAEILKQTESITTIATTYSNRAYLDRNIAMVEMSNQCIAVWDGTPGGTAHAVGAAQVHGLSVDIINPKKLMR